jgi:predicted CoA-binding protein
MSDNSSISPARRLIEGVRSIAVVGVSTNKRKFGSAIYRELKRRGFEVFGVHPSLETIEGDRCFASVTKIDGRPDCVVVCVKPKKAVSAVDQTVAKGISRIWFQQGADFSEAKARAEEAGLQAVSGRCILMYTEPVGGIHRFHRGLSKLFGKY